MDLEEATVAELQAAMEQGRLTSRSLVEAYVSRMRSRKLTEHQSSHDQLSSTTDIASPRWPRPAH